MTKRAWLMSGIAAVQCFNSCLAQTVPDAGRLEDRSRPAPPAQPAPKVIINPAAQPGQPALTEGTLMVNGFRFSGDLEGIAPATLQSLVAGEGGKVYALSELHSVADKVEHYLQTELGLVVAKAWVPLQDVQDGVVEIRVLQGTVEQLKIAQPAGQAAVPDAALTTARNLLPPGSALSRARLEEAVYRMSDYLGTPVRAVLIPAPALGHYDLQFEPDPSGKVSGSISVDNTGNRYTSQWHETLNLKVANLTGHADQLTLTSQLLTPNQRTLRVHYDAPLPQDYRIGATLQGSRYKLCCAFAPLDAHGHTELAALDLQHAWRRSRTFNLYGSAELLYRRLSNYQLGRLTSEHSVSELTLGLKSDWASGEAFNYGWFNLTGGHVSLDGDGADALTDQLGPDLRGGFGKANFGYTRSQPLTSNSNLVVNLSGQLASKNLDSSETFLLGGMGAVRAYPNGETAGDQSLVAQIEYHHQLGSGLRGFAFYDHGWITVRKQPWAGFVGDNNFALKGIGLGLTWNMPSRIELSLIGARKLGSNPLADPLGNDSDGRSSRYRFWGFATYRF
ncbi:MAG: ShlB/FhaC/HecB family hemolysin secretion/activation protein [Pseudomonadota bacterium]